MKPIKHDIEREEIKHVASFKYLRGWLEEGMSFNEHIQHIAARISCTIGLIFRTTKYMS